MGVPVPEVVRANPTVVTPTAEELAARKFFPVE